MACILFLSVSYSVISILHLSFFVLLSTASLHLAFLHLVLLVLYHNSFTLTSLNKIHINDYYLASVNLPIIECQLSQNGNYIFSATSLYTNSIETKPFYLSNFNYITSQTYNVSIDDILTSISVYDYYNVLVVYTLIILSYLHLKYSKRNIIIRY